MKLEHRAVVWHKDGSVAHYHAPPGVENTLGDGETAEDIAARHEDIAAGLIEPMLPDLETLTALVSSLHEEHNRISIDHAQLEAKHQALDAIHTTMLSAVTKGTDAGITAVRREVERVAKTLAMAHQSAQIVRHVQRENAKAEAALAPLRAEHKSLEDLAAKHADAHERATKHANLLEALGIDLDADPAEVRATIEAMPKESRDALAKHAPEATSASK